jgi:branched-chain amino acid transport system permease protein
MSVATVDLAAGAHLREPSPLRRALGVGLVLGGVAVYGATVGIPPLMDARWIIVNVVSLGDAALIAIGLGAGAMVAAPSNSTEFRALAPRSLLAGGVAGGLLALLACAMQVLPLRRIFIALSPALLKTLTFGLGAPLGGVILIVGAALLAVLGVVLALAPERLRKPVLVGLAFVVVSASSRNSFKS